MHRRALELDDGITRGVVSIGRNVGHVHHWTNRRFGFGEQAHHFVLRALLAVVHNDGFQLLTVGHAVAKGGEARVAGVTQQLQHPGSNGVAAGAHANPLAVAALIGAARRCVGKASAQARLHFAGEFVERQQRAHHLKDALEQADIDHLANAAVQRNHRCECANESGHFVGECDGGQHWLAAGHAADRGQPAHHFGDAGEPWPVAIRPGLTKAGDARDDQRRVDRV